MYCAGNSRESPPMFTGSNTASVCIKVIPEPKILGISTCWFTCVYKIACTFLFLPLGSYIIKSLCWKMCLNLRRKLLPLRFWQPCISNCRGKNPHIYWIVSQLLVMILLNNFGRIICSNMRFHPHINVCVNISSKVCILCIYLAHLSLTGKIHLRS